MFTTDSVLPGPFMVAFAHASATHIRKVAAAFSATHQRRLVLVGMASMLLLSGCMLSPLFQAPAALMTGVAVLLGLAACSGGGGGGGGGGDTTEGPQGWPAVASLSWISDHATFGLMLEGPGNGQAGRALSAGVDVTGDGKGDLLIGEPQIHSGGFGSAYLVFGGAGLAALGGNGPVALGDLTSSQALLLSGEAGTARVGYSVLLAPDMNGDSSHLGEVVIGGPKYQGSVYQQGITWVVFGDPSLTSLGTLVVGTYNSSNDPVFNGNQGFIIKNFDPTAPNAVGTTLVAGDFNGDGKGDLAIAAPVYANSVSVKPHVDLLLGSYHGEFGLFDESYLDSTGAAVGRRFTYNASGSGGSNTGKGMAAGDFNGDGHQDLAIGMPSYGANREGMVSVVFGVSSGDGTAFPADPTTVNGTNGLRVVGTHYYDTNYTGYSTPFRIIVRNDYQAGGHVALGDVDGDGFSDLLIGTRYQYSRHNDDGYGGVYNYTYNYERVHVVFHQNLGSGVSAVTLSQLSSAGFQLELAYGETLSSMVAGVDLNNDGVGDFIVGVGHGAADGNSNVTVAYVVFGSSTLHGSFLGVSELDGTNGFRVVAPPPAYASGGVLSAKMSRTPALGITAPSQFGYVTVTTGDVNGDGIKDVIIATNFHGESDGPGQIYIVFGFGASGGYPAYTPPDPQ